MKCNYPKFRIVILVWLVFSVLYVAFGEYNRLKNGVYNMGYERGQMDTVANVIVEAQKCQPFPVTLDKAQTTLVSLECLQAAQAEQEEE